MRNSSSKKRATLQDVARAAGVGPMTVSRTINGHPYVAEETARKVHEAIRRLGYRPNHAARMLTGKLSRSIGLIVPDISDTFFSVVSHAVQETARASGYLVWLAASDDDPTIEAAQVEMMMHHPVDGILLVPVDSRSRYLEKIAGGTTPIVAIDRPVEVASTDSVGVENRSGARMAVEHLINMDTKESPVSLPTFICFPSKSALPDTRNPCDAPSCPATTNWLCPIRFQRRPLYPSCSVHVIALMHFLPRTMHRQSGSSKP